MTTPAERDKQPPRSRRSTALWLLVIVAALLVPWLVAPLQPAPASWSYTALLTRIQADQVTSLTLDTEGRIRGKARDGTSFASQLPTALGSDELAVALRQHHVTTEGKAPSSGWQSALLGWVPFLLIAGFLYWSYRRASGSGALNPFGRARTHPTKVERPNARFSDVAGYEVVKREMAEVVDVLEHPTKYLQAGAKAPRGVLLLGPPGTGKTLLARAVAGEAELPFLTMTGSSFVELYVGVGAARVRELFEEARKLAPAIVFIDEIDAIGGRRARAGMAGNDEREQTLNQLLAEMDGFDQSCQIVVLAATNRPDTLDAALLRPGRFDRQITVPLPTASERAEILHVHATSRHLDAQVDLDRTARSTPGFSGADLANLVNEAALNAVRDDRSAITPADLDTARERVLLGAHDGTTALLPEERARVAVHESGHALVAALSPHADPVDRITILPTGAALGRTEQLPVVERHLYSAAYLEDTLAVRLAGRAAERVVLGELSSGAANDLAEATALATRMVLQFGLSDAVGPVSYPEGMPLAPATQALVDREVRRLVQQAEERAVALLGSHGAALDELVRELAERETLDGSAVTEVLAGEHRVASAETA